MLTKKWRKKTMKRITFEVSDEVKIALVKECILTNVKIKGLLTGLFLTFVNSDEETKKSLRVKIVKNNT
jgi:hypothetical protein